MGSYQGSWGNEKSGRFKEKEKAQAKRKKGSGVFLTYNRRLAPGLGPAAQPENQAASEGGK